MVTPLSASARDVVTRFDDALADPSADQSVVYKTVDATDLELNIFKPSGNPLPKRPAILWFHGGGWTSGFPAYLAPQAAYFAGLGYLTVTAEYRWAGNSTDNTTFDCVEDARDAFYWMVENAAALGIDPANIIVAGESAGGHLAACVGYIEDPRASGIPIPQPYPVATILINPITDIAPIPWAMDAAALGPEQTTLAESISSGIPIPVSSTSRTAPPRVQRVLIRPPSSSTDQRTALFRPLSQPTLPRVCRHSGGRRISGSGMEKAMPFSYIFLICHSYTPTNPSSSSACWKSRPSCSRWG